MRTQFVSAAGLTVWQQRRIQVVCCALLAILDSVFISERNVDNGSGGWTVFLTNDEAYQHLRFFCATLIGQSAIELADLALQNDAVIRTGAAGATR